MERWNQGNMGLGGAVVAALLLPGGILLLAWALYRKYGSRLAGRWLSIAAAVALLQGCATQLAVRPASGPELEDAVPGRHVLQFQSSVIAPGSGDAPLSAKSLRPGDIILTSAPSFVSTAIQVTTLAPVSHAAIYIGEGKVVEAVRPATRVRSLDDLLAEETIVLAFRHPDLTAEQGLQISNYALQKSGTPFNYLGVTLNLPVAIGRRLCELPLVPSALRDACVRGIGVINYLADSESRLFCSQLVLDSYRRAGLAITDADPRLISLADILHMREGDVPSVRIHKPLRYVGHLKYQLEKIAALEYLN